MNPEFMNGRKSANNAVAIDVAIIKRPSHEEGGGGKALLKYRTPLARVPCVVAQGI